MHISSVDLDANVAVVHLDGVERALPGADVALAWERGYGDGVSLLEQGHVVAQGSIHVELRKESWLSAADSHTHSNQSARRVRSWSLHPVK